MMNYPIGGMNMMSGMNSMNSMPGPANTIHQNFKNQYGVGYEDFGSRPYAAKYPMALTPKAQLQPIEKTEIVRILRKLFFLN